MCRLLITFANSFDPDQARHNVGPDLNLNCLTLMLFLKEYIKKVFFFLKALQTIKKIIKNYPACKELRECGDS